MRISTFFFILLSLPAVAAPNPERKAIAEFLSSYMNSSERYEIFDGFPTISQGKLSLKEMKQIVELLESRIGKESVVDALEKKTTVLLCRLRTLRALISASDALIGEDGTNRRLMESLTNFTGPHGDLSHIIKVRFTWRNLPGALKAADMHHYEETFEDLAKAVDAADGLIPAQQVHTILAKHVRGYETIRAGKYQVWCAFKLVN